MSANRPGHIALRTALLSTAALALVVGLAQPADSATRKPKHTATEKKKPNPERDGFAEARNGVQQIVVSIGTQRVTLFSNGVRMAQGPVSTGTPGHPTPMGIFSVIQKDRYHHSNLYGNAPMFYMQRITWSGVAMHEGVLPGHAASHGCIRLSHGFAAALWPTTKLGVRVIVSRNDLAPTPFEHSKLFTPKPKPAEPPEAMTEPKAKLLQVAESANISTDARADAPDATPEVAKPAPVDADRPKPLAPAGKASENPAKRIGQVAVFVSRKEKKLYVRQGMIPVFETPITIDEPDRPMGTHVFTALGPQADGSGMRWNLITVLSGPQKEAEKPRARNKKHGEPPKPVVVESKTASTAAEALDRIELPKEAVDRISEMLVPGSSLIVSDLGTSYETGRGTEFIILTR
jgi:hypothetical protein